VAAARCWFCHEQRPLSKEHLISEPIAEVFGIDREDLLLLDMPTHGIRNADDIAAARIQPLARQAVGSACAPCNNGWMNNLEHRAARVFKSWLRGQALDPGSHETISAWLLGRLIVWMYRDAGHRQMLERAKSGLPVTIANPVQGKSLAMGDWRAALETTAAGAAACSGAGVFGFGHATTHPRQLRVLTAVLALELAPLQLWIANVAIPGGEIAFPSGVKHLDAGLRVAELNVRRGPHSRVSPGSVIVRF